MDAAAYAAVNMGTDGRTSWPPSWKYDVISKIQLSQSIHIYLRNNPAKFHPDQIWNDGALGGFEELCPNKKNKNNKKSSDMESVPGPINE